MDNILEFKDLTKIYPGVTALNHVSFSIERGEVHALVGENGAGKSTLIKTLTGAIAPTSGTIVYDGREYRMFNARQAIQEGISVIYQEFNSIRYLSVAENIFYGHPYKNGPFVDFKRMNEEAAEMCRNMGLNINPKTKLQDLSVAYQQIVEILKAVSLKSKVMIMDEPTAPLTNNETEALFRLIKKLKSEGTTIIYISHRLEEIFEVADRISVMRDGHYIKTLKVEETNLNELIALMVGRELGQDYPKAESGAGDEIALKVEDIHNDAIRGVSFELKKGEILGLGGLVGAGRTELIRAIYGADKISRGTIFKSGKRIRINNPKDAVKNRIALIPEDRKRHGVILDMKIYENITFSSLKNVSRYGFLNKQAELNISREEKDAMNIKTPSLAQYVKNLSGGNQQKVVLAKGLAMGADIILFDEPTRGIDVGAKQEIYKLMRELTSMGKSIIMVSSEMPELLGMSDRLLIMRGGRVLSEMTPDQYDQEAILRIASGM